MFTTAIHRHVLINHSAGGGHGLGRSTFGFLLLAALLIGPDRRAQATTNYTLVGWNNLGMHCMDNDFSVFSLLPPYNTIMAQLVDSTGKLVINPTNITVTYQAIADPTGSINTTSIGKANFYNGTDRCRNSCRSDVYSNASGVDSRAARGCSARWGVCSLSEGPTQLRHTRAIIRYTVDGTDPNRSSPTYKKTGVTITNSITLKAKAFKVKMVDSEVVTALFTVLPPLPLTIATIHLPAGALNARYNGARLAATGGVAPYKWSLQTGSKLPPGLTFNGITGVLSGMPTKAGEVAFLMKVTDAQKQTDVQSLNLTIVTP